MTIHLVLSYLPGPPARLYPTQICGSESHPPDLVLAELLAQTQLENAIHLSLI